MEKVIFIDRDGVINVDLMGYVERPQDFRFEQGAVEALKKLNNAGYNIIVISNQAGVGDGVFTSEACWDVHKHMLAELAKSDVVIFSAHYCLHGKKAGCKCRKPEIGLFKEAEKRIAFDKKKTFFIGDKATDIQAGKSYGIKTAFVRTGHGREDEKLLQGDLTPEIRGDNLEAAVDLILERYHSGPSKRKPRKEKPAYQKKSETVAEPKASEPAPVSQDTPAPAEKTSEETSGGWTKRPGYSKRSGGYSNRPGNSYRGRNDSRGSGYGRPQRRDDRGSFGGKDDFKSQDRRPPRRDDRGSFGGGEGRSWGQDRPQRRDDRGSFGGRNDFGGQDRRPPRRDDFRGQDRRPPRRDDRGSFGGEKRSWGQDRPQRRDDRGSFGGRNDFGGQDRRPPRRDDFRGQDRRPPRRDDRGSFGGEKRSWGQDRPQRRDDRGSFGGGDRSWGQNRPPRREDRGSFGGGDSSRGQGRRPGFSKRDGSGSNDSYRGKGPSKRHTYGRPPRNNRNRPERSDS